MDLVAYIRAAIASAAAIPDASARSAVLAPLLDALVAAVRVKTAAEPGQEPPP